MAVVTVDTVDTVDTTVASAPLMLSQRLRPPLRLNPNLITTVDTTAVDTTVDIEATAMADSATTDKMFIQDQVTRKLSNLANFDNEIFLFSLPTTSLQHFNVLVSVES